MKTAKHRLQIHIKYNPLPPLLHGKITENDNNRKYLYMSHLRYRKQRKNQEIPKKKNKKN
jgi:hypothetical protein